MSDTSHALIIFFFTEKMRLIAHTKLLYVNTEYYCITMTEKF